MPLVELGAYIKKHQHLPSLPTAVEVEKNGLSLGCLQLKQLEKIEELTLYLLKLEKRIHQLEKKI